jgi:hypothetical protein
MDTPAADCLYQTLRWPAVELVLLFEGLVGWQALLSSQRPQLKRPTLIFPLETSPFKSSSLVLAPKATQVDYIPAPTGRSKD